MAYATVSGKKHNVRVTRDLTDSYAVEVYPEPDPRVVKTAEPFKNWPVALTMKVMADSREDALVCALEHMKKLAQIDDFHLDPADRPQPAAPKVAKADEEEAAE